MIGKVIGFTAVFVAGLGVGSVGEAPPRKPVPVPTPRVEVRTEQIEKVVHKTPQVCLDAIQIATEGFGAAARTLDALLKAMDAQAALNVTKIQASTNAINAEVVTLTGLEPRFKENVLLCRALA